VGRNQANNSNGGQSEWIHREQPVIVVVVILVVVCMEEVM
jgi:hypothetical protein